MLEVSRSGYYVWRNRTKSARETGNDRLLEEIRRVFFESKKCYGSPRIYKQLRSEGIYCGRHRIARLMHREGIIARKRRTYKRPISAQRIQPIARNILGRNFTVKKANRVWAGDVTYFWTRTGWLHLAIVMDLFSRKIIGWSMSSRVDKEFTKEALRMALINREPKHRLIHHSDQGAEYTNKEYQCLLKQWQIIPSMSRKANCYDNAVVESFFKTIKAELVREKAFGTKEEARTAIFEYIEIFYNRKRLHSSLGYLSPEEFERQRVFN
jgi:putative transposase